MRSIAELRALADKFAGYGHLVAHEMVDEIEQLRDEALTEHCRANLWEDVAEYRLTIMRSRGAERDGLLEGIRRFKEYRNDQKDR
jgi:hypothetical protein